MIREIALSVALAVGVASGAQAWLAQSGAPPPTYTGPGDLQSFTMWAGLRAYTGAIAAAGTQALINVNRLSDSRTCDVLVASNGGFGLTANCSDAGDNGTTAETFCNATTCRTLVYDQTGNNACSATACNLTNGTTANRLTLTFNCVNTSLPCLTGNTTTMQMQSTSTMTTTALNSISAVANRSSGTSQIHFGGLGASVLRGGAANTWTLAGAASGTVANTGVADAAWHAGNCVVNGASSVCNIDGTETTGTATGNTTAARPLFGTNTTATVILWTEMGIIANVATADEAARDALCNNQRLYWATSGSC